VALDETVNADQPALEELLDQAEEEIGGGVTQISYQVEGTNLSVTKGSTGRTFDRERILFLASGGVSEALAETIAQQTGTDEEIDLNGQDVITEVAPDEPDFEAIRADVYREPKNAEMDSDHNVTDHVVGLDFDVETLKQAYDAAAEGETFTIPLTVTQPAETKESFESKLFRDVLGEGTTTVGGSANRKSNVKLSASACNGVILLPGEEFSYNNTTGSRTADKGYLEAPVYSGGASVDEVGGGICQTSSTIYYAVLHTTLKVVERAAHRYNTGYVDAGMDATVYYGSTDFRFKNNTNYPIKIVTQSYDQGGKRKLTVKIYGTNEDGSYAIPRSTTYDTVTPTTEYQADTSVPRGTTVVETKQNPYTGVKAQTYRDIYDKNGNLIETQDMGISSYKMRPKIIYYNPADGDPSTWVNGKPPQTTAETQTTDSTQASDTTASAEQTDVSAAGVVSSGDNDLPVLLDTSSFSNVT
jgi:vancomycin resistance protein YoaR